MNYIIPKYNQIGLLRVQNSPIGSFRLVASLTKCYSGSASLNSSVITRIQALDGNRNKKEYNMQEKQ